jgi:hypothetical protein
MQYIHTCTYLLMRQKIRCILSTGHPEGAPGSTFGTLDRAGPMRWLPTPNFFWMKLGSQRVSLCALVGHLGHQRSFQRTNRPKTTCYVTFIPVPTRKNSCRMILCQVFCWNILIWSLWHPFWPLVVSGMELTMTYVRDRLSSVRTRKPEILRFLPAYSHV